MSHLVAFMDGLMDHLTDPLFLYDVSDGHFTFLQANKSASAAGFQHGLDIAPGLIAVMDRVSRHGGSLTFEEKIVSPTRKIIENIVVNPILNDYGRCTHLFLIGKERTDAEVKKRLLEENTPLYQSLFDHNPDLVYELDLEGRFVDGNHIAEEISGYSVGEMRFQPFCPLLTVDTLHVAKEGFLAALQGETRNFECAIYHKQGDRIELEVTNLPIILNGTVTGVFGIAKDITEQNRLKNELIQAKETVESYFTSTVDAIYIVDRDEQIIDNNPAFETMYGYTKDEIIGKNISILIPEGETRAAALYEMIFAGESAQDIEVVRRRKDGSIVDVSLSLSPLRNAEGTITSIVAYTRDISEKKKQERLVIESEARYRLITENMTDLVAQVDADGAMIYASPSFQKVVGRQPRAGEKECFTYIHEEDRDQVINCFKNVIADQRNGRFECRVKHGDGHYIWLDTKLTAVLNEQGELQHVLCLAREVTERKQHEEELVRMAFYDYLTGALNRRLFMDHLDRTLAQAKRNSDSFAVMSLDFDRFKWVNDSLGHDVGDELLIQFVRRVKKCIREVDILARLGGDEFSILLPGVATLADVEKVAKRILSALQQPWTIKGHEFVTTSSIGIGLYPQCGDDTLLIMKHVDQALYKAKQFGRNNYQFCNQSMELIEMTSTLSFEEDVLRATENDEFYLVYQPKFNLSTNQVESVEALIRWEHHQKGLILPNQFIAHAERLNLIIPITKWVLEEVGRQSKEWKAAGYQPIPVSVNISIKHFEKGALVRDLEQMIERDIIDPEYIIIELTESMVIHDMDSIIHTISRLKQLGIKIAIDDFGTGFSSLSYLMKLHVDQLKLDQTFVRELTDQKNSTIVHSIVSLAHNLNLRVVAEGIETENQHQLLAQYGCDSGQGYFFSKPLIGKQLERVFLKRG
ncbi:EAL domain-containing protein [bacterium LRH843]|nr:EAL domain-containing protein [bacterium LRH843]